MAERQLIQLLVRLQNYLESTKETPCHFYDKIKGIISPLDNYLDVNYPYYLIVQDKVVSTWLVIYIATYLFNGKRVSVDFVSYLDRGVVRYLRNPSCLKFSDILPEIKGLSEEERANNYLSERYLLPFSSLLHPGQGKYYSQRLLTLINRIIDLLNQNTISPSFQELLRFLNEILFRHVQPSEDVTYTLDELLLLLDDLHAQLITSCQITYENLLRWKRIITIKIKALISILKPEDEKLLLHYRRKIVLITLLSILPGLSSDSKYLSTSLVKLQQQLGLAQPITIDFLESLFEDIEIYLLSGKNQDYYTRIKKWETSLVSFFSSHREECFTFPSPTKEKKEKEKERRKGKTSSSSFLSPPSAIIITNEKKKKEETIEETIEERTTSYPVIREREEKEIIRVASHPVTHEREEILSSDRDDYQQWISIPTFTSSTMAITSHDAKITTPTSHSKEDKNFSSS